MTKAVRKLEFGLGYKRVWQTYCAEVLELTAEIMVEEVDQAVQRKVNELR